jgi:hypothetical protein
VLASRARKRPFQVGRKSFPYATAGGNSSNVALLLNAQTRRNGGRSR